MQILEFQKVRLSHWFFFQLNQSSILVEMVLVLKNAIYYILFMKYYETLCKFNYEIYFIIVNNENFYK